MASDPHASFDQAVLDKIEQSPVGAVPHTPAYQDALKRLQATHQVYADADHRDGHVTARSLARLPSFYAANLEELIAGKIEPSALESDASIFDRYLQALAPDRRTRAEAFRAKVVGRSVHHRHKAAGAGDAPVVFHDPVHTLFLVPGAGPHPGLPGNYVWGSFSQTGPDAVNGPWAIHVHDNEDGASHTEAANLAEGLEKLQEVLASVPFALDELAGLGFKST